MRGLWMSMGVYGQLVMMDLAEVDSHSNLVLSLIFWANNFKLKKDHQSKACLQCDYCSLLQVYQVASVSC